MMWKLMSITFIIIFHYVIIYFRGATTTKSSLPTIPDEDIPHIVNHTQTSINNFNEGHDDKDRHITLARDQKLDYISK